MGCGPSLSTRSHHEPLLNKFDHHDHIEVVHNRLFCCRPSPLIDHLKYDMILGDEWSGCSHSINSYWAGLPPGRILVVLNTTVAEVYVIKHGVTTLQVDVQYIMSIMRPLLYYIPNDIMDE